MGAGQKTTIVTDDHKDLCTTAALLDRMGRRKRRLLEALLERRADGAA